MRLEELREAFEKLEKEVVTAGREFIDRNHFNVINPLSPEQRETQSRVLRRRDNVSYRASAVVAHVASLWRSREDSRKRFEDRGESVLAWSMDKPQEWWAFQRQQFVLFDDVIFNTMSLLDYMAGFVGAMRRNGKNFDWPELVKYCKKTKSPTMQQLANGVVNANEGWVEPLDRFRGALIHQEISSHKGQMTLNPCTIPVSWDVWFPKELKDKLPEIFGSEPDPIEIVDGALVLAHRAITSTTEIAHCAWETYPVQPRWPTGNTKLPR